MPPLTRWTIRLAMVYLILGIVAQVGYQAALTWTFDGNWSALRPVGIHFITLGWLTQLVFAVIYWMFPIVHRDNPYGERWIAWFGVVGLNLGLILRAVFEIGLTQGMPPDAGFGLVGAGLLQWSGITAWVIACQGRIRERGGR